MAIFFFYYTCKIFIFFCVARAVKRIHRISFVRLFSAGKDNSRSSQMFTSISWRIFEEARSKRVWSISSTFEYVPPFPPRAGSTFLFLPLAPSLLFPRLFRIYLNNFQPFGSFYVDELATGGKRDGREGTSGLESFQKCWLKREALKKCAPITQSSKRHSA